MSNWEESQLRVLRVARDFHGINIEQAVALGCSRESLDDLFISNLLCTPYEGQRAVLTEQGIDECEALIRVGALPESHFDDVEVSEVGEIDDDAVAAKTHRAQFADGLIAYFQTEDDACEFQRVWRSLNERIAIASDQKPSVRCVIGLEGGLITGVTSDHQLRAIIYDYDLDGAEETRVLSVPDLSSGTADVCDHGIDVADINPTKISEIFDHFESLNLAQIAESNARAESVRAISTPSEVA